MSAGSSSAARSTRVLEPRAHAGPRVRGAAAATRSAGSCPSRWRRSARASSSIRSSARCCLRRGASSPSTRSAAARFAALRGCGVVRAANAVRRAVDLTVAADGDGRVARRRDPPTAAKSWTTAPTSRSSPRARDVRRRFVSGWLAAVVERSTSVGVAAAAGPYPRRPRAPPPAELDPAREVLPRRSDGYAVNLAVFSRSSSAPDSHHLAAAVVLVPRRRDEQLHVEPPLDVPRRARPRRLPGRPVPRRRAARARSRTSSSLEVLVAFGLPEIAAQAIAIVLVTPLNFVGNKLWSFRRSR